VKEFLKQRTLSRLFIPAATFDEEFKEQDEEFVAVMEGTVFPFFGLAYSIEKVQFNIEDRLEEKIDLSKHSVRHA